MPVPAPPLCQLWSPGQVVAPQLLCWEAIIAATHRPLSVRRGGALPEGASTCPQLSVHVAHLEHKCVHTHMHTCTHMCAHTHMHTHTLYEFHVIIIIYS